MLFHRCWPDQGLLLHDVMRTELRYPSHQDDAILRPVNKVLDQHRKRELQKERLQVCCKAAEDFGLMENVKLAEGLKKVTPDGLSTH